MGGDRHRLFVNERQNLSFSRRPRAEPVMTLIPFSVPSFGFFLHPTKKRRTLQVVTQKYFSAFASRFFG